MSERKRVSGAGRSERRRKESEYSAFRVSPGPKELAGGETPPSAEPQRVGRRGSRGVVGRWSSLGALRPGEIVVLCGPVRSASGEKRRGAPCVRSLGEVALGGRTA